MTTTTPGGYDPAYTTEQRERRTRTFTETKAGAKTTEFMLAVVFIVGVLIATYLEEDSLSRSDGWRYASWVAVAYLLCRGLAKLGVSEPFSRDR